MNFLKFIEWPPRGSEDTNAPFLICVLGDDPFGSALDQILEGESVSGRPVALRRIRRPQNDCNVLFVSSSQRDLLPILRRAGRGVLTVGEGPAFLRDGGMINFVVEDRRVRFDVNMKAAESASVRISSRLLSVARSVLR